MGRSASGSFLTLLAFRFSIHDNNPCPIPNLRRQNFNNYSQIICCSCIVKYMNPVEWHCPCAYYSMHIRIYKQNSSGYTCYVDIPIAVMTWLPNMCTVCTHHSVNVDNGRVKRIVSSLLKVTYFAFSLLKYLAIPNHIITTKNAYPGLNLLW